MRASLNLLKKYVDLSNLTPEEIADKLTFAQLEVEEIRPLAKADHLVVGEILECEKHPDSNHLHVLKVDLGPKYGIKQIVCGAPNARTGLKVIVAMVGAHLGFDNIEIKQSKIRNVESNGMCCALYEIGVDKAELTPAQLNGIEELPNDAVVGNENVLEYLGLDDVIFDINVLANRPDCLSIFALAKELGALFQRKVILPEMKELPTDKSDLTVKISTDECQQFAVTEVKGLTVKESPLWLKRALQGQGIRSINNIVDIGNFIMITTGQPLHMYDLDLFGSKNFEVTSDYEGQFTALDGKTYQLQKGDIVIKNDKMIGCLGGVMGSESCAVNSNTKNIAVEAAYFNGVNVRRTSKRLGLSSDSSAHFIKGINPHQTEYVLNLTMQLLKDLADAKTVCAIVNEDHLSHEEIKIECTYSYINGRLGTEFTNEEIKNTLERLEIKVVDDGDKFTAIVPPYRIDLHCDADLSEEVIRLLGLDKVKATLPSMETTIGGLDEKKVLLKRIREHLIAVSLHEVMTYTLVSPEENKQLVFLNDDAEIKIMNPMTSDHSVMRRGLIPSLVNVVKYNIAHQNENLAIFEISEITTDKQSYNELAIALRGQDYSRGKMETRKYDFYDISGIFQAMMSLLSIDENRYKINLIKSPYLHPGRSAGIYFGNTLVGVMGEIHPSLSEDIGETYILDINLDKFLELKTSVKKMEKISRYPAISRDYAFVLKADISAGEVVKLIKKEGKNLVKNVEIFDVYQGEHIEEGYKSLALSITYQSLDKTLADNDIDPLENTIISVLNKKLGAYLRS